MVTPNCADDEDMPDAPNYRRVVEDVRCIVRHAKLDEKTLLPVAQAIYLNTTDSKDYKLMELNKELIQKIDNGIELIFRGNEDEKAVLCSDDKTYEVKEAETSNSLLLIPNLKFPEHLKQTNEDDMIVDHKNILGIFHTYLELKPCKPKMQKLRLLLEASAYRGSELEFELIESGTNLYSTSDLLNLVQASEAELMAALEEIEAVELDNKWRILEFDYHFRVLSYFLGVIDEQSWKIDEIPVQETKELLTDLVPIEILNHLLRLYTKDVSCSSSKALVQLNEDRTCRFLGQFLLRSTSRFGLNDFLQAWKGCVPLGLNVKLSQLDGLIYVTTEPTQKVINYLPQYELSEDVAERIQFLFTLKEKWSLEEIKPYIQPFTTDKIDENGLLTRYARASKANGIRVFSSKHGK